MNKQSSFLSLNLQDVGKGFLVAILTVVVTGLGTSLQAGQFPTMAELEHLGLMGLGSGVAYLLKNVFTNNTGDIAKPDQK